MPLALALALTLASGQFGTGSFSYSSGSANATTVSARKVCVIGDSLAVGAPYAATPVMTRLLQYIGADTWTLLNAAVGGTRADAIRDSYTTQIKGKGCTWLLVEGGTNTIVDGTAGIGTTAWNQIKTAVDAALADGLFVILHTVPPRSTGPSYSAGVQTGLDDFNTAARAYAAANPTRIKLVDLYSTHGEPGTPIRLRVTYDAGDGLHMTQAGQDRWACDASLIITPTNGCTYPP